jgi:transposase
MPLRSKPTRELLDRIVANYRQTGDLANAAIRSGISRSTLYEWKRRGEKANSGLLAEFAKNFMPLRPKPTRELLDRIVANYRQTGDLTNAAIRSGISRSTLYEWKRRGEKANSGLLAEFAKNLTRAREDEIAIETMRHKQLAQGGVLKLPVHDQRGRVMRDKNGDVVFEEVVVLPNRQALETRLRWKAPGRFPGRSAKTEPAKESQSEEIEHARSSKVEDRFISVARRMAATGLEYKPSIETTAKKEEEANLQPVDKDKD